MIEYYYVIQYLLWVWISLISVMVLTASLRFNLAFFLISIYNNRRYHEALKGRRDAEDAIRLNFYVDSWVESTTFFEGFCLVLSYSDCVLMHMTKESPELDFFFFLQ